MVLVTAVSPSAGGDGFATLKDPTASMGAAIHSDVMSSERELVVGATLVLQNVSVFSPLPTRQYLCITVDNVVQVFPPTRTRYPDHISRPSPLEVQLADGRGIGTDSTATPCSSAWQWPQGAQGMCLPAFTRQQGPQRNYQVEQAVLRGQGASHKMLVGPPGNRQGFVIPSPSGLGLPERGRCDVRGVGSPWPDHSEEPSVNPQLHLPPLPSPDYTSRHLGLPMTEGPPRQELGPLGGAGGLPCRHNRANAADVLSDLLNEEDDEDLLGLLTSRAAGSALEAVGVRQGRSCGAHASKRPRNELDILDPAHQGWNGGRTAPLLDGDDSSRYHGGGQPPSSVPPARSYHHVDDLQLLNEDDFTEFGPPYAMAPSRGHIFETPQCTAPNKDVGPLSGCPSVSPSSKVPAKGTEKGHQPGPFAWPGSGTSQQLLRTADVKGQSTKSTSRLGVGGGWDCQAEGTPHMTLVNPFSHVHTFPQHSLDASSALAADKCGGTPAGFSATQAAHAAVRGVSLLDELLAEDTVDLEDNF